MRSASLLVVIIMTGTLAGCRNNAETGNVPAATGPKAVTEDLATARAGFVTKLRVRGPAPQPYDEVQSLAGATKVEYASGGLKLKGWLSSIENGGKKMPAVVFLHGGWAFGEGDWKDAAPFAKAGFVLFMPMLRGENGNPGIY